MPGKHPDTFQVESFLLQFCPGSTPIPYNLTGLIVTRLMKQLVWRVATYGCESWTLRKNKETWWKRWKSWDTQARKTTHGLDGQHHHVDSTPRGRVNQNDRGQS